MTVEILDVGPVDVDEFNEFWAAYPRKRDRAKAQAAYRRARRTSGHGEILAAVHALAREVVGRPADEISLAVGWLRGESWLKPADTQIRVPRRRPLRPARTAPVRLTPAEQKAKWLREHGITESEYESRKDDTQWLQMIERRGRVQ